MSTADVSRSSSSSADSYIGSLISLTSKSDIRYEGILYNINTEESSIGLRNVRSFGSEGRKEDGAQVPPSDKVYAYILFRGSDIKDLQVKTSATAPPVQPAQPINNDPAIIQSNNPRPGPTLSNLQVGPTGPGFQGGMPLYQPDRVNTSGLAMPPMYLPGYYAPPNGLPHQQSLYRPTPMQYPGFASSLPGGLPNLSGYPTSTPSSLLGSTLPSGLPPVPALLSSSEPPPSFMQTKASNSVGPTALPPVSLTASITTTSIGPNVTVNGLSGVPMLVTPDQLLQAGAQAVHKEVEPIVPQAPKPALLSEPSAPIPASLFEPSALAPAPKPAVSSELSAPIPAALFEPSALVPSPKPVVSSELSAPVVGPTETQPPILPLPIQTSDPPKTNGGQFETRNSYRGRGTGRGSVGPRSVVKFTEEFDFTAMNEKFNKDEVWGTLGKSNNEYDFEDENDAFDVPKVDVKPGYSKDDFFDTLSCNNDNRSNNGRTRFSELMKLDTETFGEFSRYRGGGRGGRGPYRGGRSRGGGYHGRGFGNVNRARGGRNPARDY